MGTQTLISQGSTRIHGSAQFPAWRPAEGQFALVTTTNKMNDIMYGSKAGGEINSGFNDYHNNYGGGAALCVADNSILFCGGGDSDYWGNEVHRLGLLNLTWTRLGPGRSTAPGPNGNEDGTFDTTWGEHADDQPAVPHPYDQVEYLPPAMGGGAKGSFLFATRCVAYTTLKFKHPHAFDVDDDVWRRASASADIAGTGNSEAPTCMLDETRSRIWISGAGSGSGEFWSSVKYYTFSGGLATTTSVSTPEHLTPYYAPVSRHHVARDLWVMIGYNTAGDAVDIHAAKLSTIGSTGFATVTLSGDTIPPTLSMGMAYCPDLECMFVRPATGNRQKIWKVEFTSDTAATVTEITMAGDTVGTKNNANGMAKRLMWSAYAGCLLWVDDQNAAVLNAYRPVGV